MARIVPLVPMVTVAAAMSLSLSALTPEEAVRRAIAGHPQIQSSIARVESARAVTTQAALKPNPRLFVQSENTRISRAASPFRYAEDTDNFLYLSQVIERGGKRESRTGLAREVTARREAELDVRRQEIARRVLFAYWTAAGAERTRDLLRNTLTNFEQTVQYHRDRVREGALAEADLIRVELEKEQVEVSFRNASQDAVRTRLDLLREIADPNLAANVPLEADFAAPTLPLLPDGIPEVLANNRADLRLGARLISQSDAAIRLEQANAKPDPEVLAGYKRTSGYNTLIAGVQINIPFRNRNQGNIAAAIAEKRAATADLEAASLAARTEVQSARTELEQKLRLLRDEIPRILRRAQETARIARAVYREGAGDLLRLLDAERAGLQAELLHVRTLIESRIALVQLQAALGTLPQ